MSMSDLMSSFDLTIFPQIAIVIFAVTFVVVVWRGMRTSQDLSRMPFDEQDAKFSADGVGEGQRTRAVTPRSEAS